MTKDEIWRKASKSRKEIKNYSYGDYFAPRHLFEVALDEYSKPAIELLRTIYLRNRHDMGVDVEISEVFEKMGIEL